MLAGIKKHDFYQLIVIRKGNESLTISVTILTVQLIISFSLLFDWCKERRLLHDDAFQLILCLDNYSSQNLDKLSGNS